LKKIAELFAAILKDPIKGIGKPEGFWSRRINEEHRIVYTIIDDAVVIVSCRSHYEI